MKKKEMQIFNSSEFGEVRIIGTPDNPLFCLADVCRALELDPSQVIRRLESTVFSKHPADTGYGIKEVNFINEDGLYDVIFDSRKPEAKKFRKWVTSEVLPSIRKHGAYMTDATLRKVSKDMKALRKLVNDLKRDNRRIKQENEYNVETMMWRTEQETITQKVIDNQRRIPSYTTEQLELELDWDKGISLQEALIQFSLLLPTADGKGRINPKYEGMGLYFLDFTSLLRPIRIDNEIKRPTILWTDRGRAAVHLVAKHYEMLHRDIRDTVEQFEGCIANHLTRFQRTYTTLIQ